MPTPGRELAGWTEQRWQAVQGAVDKALAGTARCRQVIPKGPEKIGEKAVVVPRIAAPAPGQPICYEPDVIASPIQIYADEAEILRLVEVAAAQLGMVEDQEIVQGAPPAAAPAGLLAAVLIPAAPPLVGRVPRNPALARMAASAPGNRRPPVPIPPGGAFPNGDELYASIAHAVAELEDAGRPGPCGLLVHSRLMATLRQPRVPGGVPLIQEVEGLIGSSEIVGTSALSGNPAWPNIGAILFRLEPAAMDLVHTMLPTVTVLSRANGTTDLRVEEDIVLRILDPAAVQTLAYGP
jgi:uncharacterized linocin/CFP29 family protein